MRTNTVVILTAVMLEARALARALGLRKSGEGRFEGGGIELHVIGIKAGRMPGLRRETAVILAGLAGGLDPGVGIGEIIVEVGSPLSPPSFAPLSSAPLAFSSAFSSASALVLPQWEGLLEAARGSGAAVRGGTIYCADHVVATVAEKRALFAATGALAVEMEGAAVRRALLARGEGEGAMGAFAHVRAISDTAEEALDPAVLGLVDELGRPKPWAVAKTLVAHPSAAGRLKRLGENAQRAAENLGAVVAAVARERSS